MADSGDQLTEALLSFRVLALYRLAGILGFDSGIEAIRELAVYLSDQEVLERITSPSIHRRPPNGRFSRWWSSVRGRVLGD